MHAAETWHGRCIDAAHVAVAAAAVFGCVAVEQLAPESAVRRADSIVVAWHRREVADDRNLLAAVGRLAQEADDAAVGVVGVDPLEAVRIATELMQCRLVAVGLVQGSKPA